MQNRLYWLRLLAVLLSLAACTPRAGQPPVMPPAQTQLPTATSLPATVTLQVPRWKYWERALGDILNGPSGNTHPDLSQEHGRCEWDIYGQTGREVYVWAYCELYQKGIGVTAGSGPAIVRLAPDDSISEVIFPEATTAIRPLVPAAIWLRITKRDFDVAGAQKDLGLRSADPTLPPLIIQEGVQLP